MVKESSKHRDSFLWFLSATRPWTPSWGRSWGPKGRAPKPLFFVLPQFVCLLESWPKILLFTDLPWLAVLKCSHSLLSFLMEWGWFLSSHFIWLQGLKHSIVSVHLSSCALLAYMPVPRAEILFSFNLQGQRQVCFQSLLVFPCPHIHHTSQEKAGTTLSAGISSASWAADFGVRLLN